MAFCRSCGDIVVGQRCGKCGGLPVAPSVKFEKGEGVRDRWSKTYVETPSSPTPSTSTPPKSPSPVRSTSPLKSSPRPTTPTSSSPIESPRSTSLTKSPSRFPRPMGGYGASSAPTSPSSSNTLSRMSAHINASTTPRSTSPLKNQFTGARTEADYAAEDITVVKSHITGSLVKVHGSILERPESLANFACYECLLKFTPDATIYPSPTDEGKFLCRDCFESHDESIKGVCEECHKPILALTKEEGGKPIENAGRLWHGACFRCKACDKDIRRNPMVDILGRPCCEDCFDDCLQHGSPSPAPQRTRTKSWSEPEDNSSSRSIGGKSREGTPVMEELSKRLGLSPSPPPSTKETVTTPPRPTRSRANSEVSPTIERLTRKLNALANGDSSPEPKYQHFSPASSPTKAPPKAPPPPPPPPAPRSPFLAAPKSSHHRLSGELSDSSTSTSLYKSDSASSSRGHSLLSSSQSSETYASSVTSDAESFSTDSPTFNTKKSYQSMMTEESTTPTKSPVQRRSMIPVPSARAKPSSTTTSYPPSSTLSPYVTPKTKRLSTIPGSTETTPTLSKTNTPLRASGTPRLSTVASPSPLAREKERREQLGRDSPLSAYGTPESLMSGRCDACDRPLLVQDMRGPIVTIPVTTSLGDDEEDEEEIRVERFHHACFCCAVCGDSFGELEGKANFVREEGKPVHISCASPLRVTTTLTPAKALSPIPAPVFQRESSVPRDVAEAVTKPSTRSPSVPRTREKTPVNSARTVDSTTVATTTAMGATLSSGSGKSASPVRATTPFSASPASHRSPPPASRSYTTPASQMQGSPASSPSASAAVSNGRFTCGGCHQTVFQMERGVVPGPLGGKWHVLCLVCGGKDWKSKSLDFKRWGRGPNDEGSAELGCGKKLDSQARMDRIGRVYCRDCLGKLPAELRGPASPVRGAAPDEDSPVLSQRTGGTVRVASHLTGASSKSVATPFSAHDPEESSSHRYPRPRSASPVRRQITGGSGYLSSRGLGSASTVKSQATGASSVAQTSRIFAGSISSDFSDSDAAPVSATSPLAQQVTGGGLPVTHAYAAPRPHSVIGNARLRSGTEIKPQWTGSSTSSMGGGGGPGEGRGVVSPQTTGSGLLVTRPRPKSVLGSRGVSGMGGRGIELVRQMTGGRNEY
ncbi:hypothetical protein DL93DRAFT_785970 [Clavulina sp. PMI_390]|nr:hypothetical protein DL93DRAFT_785970 [Clavulina sp. PMI_390]